MACETTSSPGPRGNEARLSRDILNDSEQDDEYMCRARSVGGVLDHS